MIKGLVLLFITLCTLSSASCYVVEAENIIIIPMAGLTISLEPGKTFSLKNPLIFGVKINCSIQTADASDSISAHVTKGKASLNGNPVPSGGLTVDVHNGDTLRIEASGSTSADLLNNGTSTVTADCNLAQETVDEIEATREALDLIYENETETETEVEEEVQVDPEVEQIENELVEIFNHKIKFLSLDD